MNRKTLILCLSVLAVMVLGLGVAVAFLYSGADSDRPASSKVADESRYLLLPAVPSDAVAVFCYSDVEDASMDFFDCELTEAAGSSRTVISVHHCGAAELKPLYIFDAGRASSSPSQTVSTIIETAENAGFYTELIDCSSFEKLGKHLSGRSVVLASKQENLVRSSIRHLQEGLSIMDAPGFTEASEAVSSNDVLFIANEYSQKLMSAIMTKKYSRHAGFFSRFADWMVFDIEDEDRMSGAAVYEKSTADFMEVLEASQPQFSSLSSVLPSFTIFAGSVSIKNPDSYIAAYEGFVDSKQELARYRARQNELSRSAGMTVEDFIRLSAMEEIAKAAFKVEGKIENVNLMKVGKGAVPALFPEEIPGKNYVPAVHPYAYHGFLASVFGKFFELEDESCFTYINGWVISGSQKAVDEYVTENVLEYSLTDKLRDAGKQNLLSNEPVLFQAYFSFDEDKDSLGDIFSKKALPYVNSLIEGYDYCPMVLRVSKDKKGSFINADLLKTQVKRTKAPEKDRDTTVVIPQGPFEVKNSGTGKMNKFYQNSHLSLCLSQDGKDLWGIPFKEKICGFAQTVDYYANGKLQILFGAGSKMYLIDRLGRFVSGFPVDLGKEILLGPQPYDFNGIHRYNAMVLHKDNTVELYDMKGKRAESWKGIKVEETIKSLPEMIMVGGKSFWVLRTSIQTLIFPFDGGEPVTKFEGNKKIRPDSPVTVLDEGSIEVECYDGHKRTVKIK